MSNNTPPTKEQLRAELNDYSSKQATFNSKTWLPNQKRQAEREWIAIQDETCKKLEALFATQLQAIREHPTDDAITLTKAELADLLAGHDEAIREAVEAD